MIFSKTSFLTYNKTLLADADAKLHLYTAETGELVLMASIDEPNGHVFFSTNARKLHLFLNDQINLQSLFKASGAGMVTVLSHNEFEVYVLGDKGLQLCYGENYFSEFKENAKVIATNISTVYYKNN